MKSQCRPLNWPDIWINQSLWGELSVGLPLVGLDKRVLRILHRQLSIRPSEALALWKNDPALMECRDRVSSLLQEYFYWPNNHFIPDDPCEILFWDPSSELRLAEAITVLTDAYPDKEDLLVGLQKMKYGQFVEALARWD